MSAETEHKRVSPSKVEDFLDDAHRARIVELAMSWEGTPFHHLGRQPGHALDCGGLIVCAANEDSSIYMSDERAYSNQPWGQTLLPHCRRVLHELPIDEWDYAARIILVELASNVPHHMGISVGDGRIVHCWWKANRVITTDTPPSWQRRICNVFDFKRDPEWQP